MPSGGSAAVDFAGRLSAAPWTDVGMMTALTTAVGGRLQLAGRQLVGLADRDSQRPGSRLPGAGSATDRIQSAGVTARALSSLITAGARWRRRRTALLRRRTDAIAERRSARRGRQPWAAEVRQRVTAGGSPCTPGIGPRSQGWLRMVLRSAGMGPRS